jgi:imidazolonepropionase-like amidohydrolase
VEIQGIHVWDGEQDRGLMHIRAEDGRIQIMEPTTVDHHPGLALIPGLIDTHVHLQAYAGAEPVDERYWHLVTPSEERTLHAAAQAQKALAVGVTTLRDMASREIEVAVARAFAAGVLAGPRVLTHGWISMTAGHGDLITPPGFPVRPPTADGPTACRRMVREYARLGVDGIKIFTSGGVLSIGDRNEWRNFTAEELAAIVDEAHALGLPVAAHTHTEAGIAAALEAGVDSLEHATAITADQARQAAERGITVAPTLLIAERIASGAVPVPAESRRKAEALLSVRDAALQRAFQLGAPLVLGTDASGMTLPLGSEWGELAAMVSRIGMTPEDALRAATSRAARAVGLADRIGHVAPGYEADLVVVQGAPWRTADDMAADKVQAVWRGGTLVAGRWVG